MLGLWVRGAGVGGLGYRLSRYVTVEQEGGVQGLRVGALWKEPVSEEAGQGDGGGT